MFAACWVETTIHPVYGTETSITRCRISGGEIVDYADDTDVPSTLYPQPGTDATGECWFYTSLVTQYVIVALYPNGDADLGWDPDPAPGGIIAIGVTYPRCSSEPTPTEDPVSTAWEYVYDYIHPPPTPEVNPAPGDGVTGLDTFVGVQIPDDHSATLSAGGTTVFLSIEVSAVVVEWGDGGQDTYPATESALSGYPDGIASHIYEIKSEGALDLRVSYDWTASWRVAGGPWTPIAVPDTTTTVAYPVAEIVSVLSD